MPPPSFLEPVASQHGHWNRTAAPVETSYPCHRYRLAGRRVVLLRSAGLGHTHQFDHGGTFLPDGLMVNARDGGTPLATMAIDVVLDVVHGRRVLLDLLALQKPRGTGADAGSKCTGVTVAKCAHPPKIGHFVKLAPIAHRRGGLSGLQIHVNVH